MKKGWVFALTGLAAAAAALVGTDFALAKPEILLGGAEEYVVEAGQYEEQPVQYRVSGLFGRQYEKRLITGTSGVVDVSRPGEYVLNYTARFRKRESTATRRVKVVDNTAPVIELFESGRQANPLLGYQEEGFRASDFVDGDLSDAVSVSWEGDRLRYSVSDSAGNECVVYRNAVYCDWRPAITLTDGDIEIDAYTNFEEPGFLALDECGNDLSAFVEVTGTQIPSYKCGTYTVVYTVVGPDGQESVTAERRVTVRPVGLPAEKRAPGKVMYLTFDDGPSEYTGQLLDILGKYNVKATFFVTGNRAQYRDFIGRAYREGHKIGVHTYSHNLERIYASTQAFMDDLYKAQEVVFEQTGHYTRLMRFAGGSSCIRFYNTDLTVSLLRTVSEAGMKYFDWNVSSGDGAIHTTEETFGYVKMYASRYDVCVVLQHDTKLFSINAVEDIIKWGLENGYRFETLDVDCWGSQQRSY